MACVPTPTLTQTNIVTTESISLSNSGSVTTAPGSVVTQVSASCAASSGVGANATCISTVSVTSLSTAPGGITTIQVPFTWTVPVTQTQVTTLFGSSCKPTGVSSTTSSTTTSLTPVTSFITSSVLSVSTPPPTIITTQSSVTMADGSVVVQYVTTTSTIPPTSVLVPTTVPDSSGNQSSQNNNNNNNGGGGGGGSSTNLGPIIGGVVGGFFGLIGIVFLIWFIIKRRSRWDDIFDREEQDIIAASARRVDRDDRFSVDVDIEPKPYQYGLVGQVASAPEVSPPSSPPPMSSIPLSTESAYSRTHGRHRSSLAPLNVPMSASNSIPSATTVSSRPSTAGSTQPLRPHSQFGQGQGRPAEFGARPVSMHSHSNTSSITSPPLGLPNWNNNIGVAANMGMGMGMGTGMDDGHNANRSGSPISIQEPPRRLQLANVTALSPTSPDTPQQYQPEQRPSLEASGSSNMSRNTGTSVATTTTTGKGPIVLRPPGAGVRVHTDGGVLPDGPPAYEA